MNTHNILNLRFIKEVFAREKLSIPRNAFLIDNALAPTAENLRALFPQAARIFALDFEVRFPQAYPGEYLLGPNGEVLGLVNHDLGIINIDHHSYHTSFDTANISTTHQALIAMQFPELIPTENDAVAVNHLDIDSTLSLLVLMFPHLAPLLKIMFAHTAIDADHTGAGGLVELIVLVDALYEKRDLNLTLSCVRQLLLDGTVDNLPHEILAEYEAELRRRELVRQIVEKREFVEIGAGVILICPKDAEHIQTLTFPGILEEHGVNCSVVIIASQTGATCKLNVRQGRNFPEGTTLQKLSQQLNLSRFGYGGRAKAGGNSRSLGPNEPITGLEFAELLAAELTKLSD
jgi:hypothetical protein